jgi:hypothetical protein
MIPVLLLAAFAQIPVELHANGTVESRLLLRAVTVDLPTHDEDSRLIRHYQDELRRIVRIHNSWDTFVKIGQHKERLPLTAFDNPCWTVLSVKREVDIWNAAQRRFQVEKHDAEDLTVRGIVDLGDEGQAVTLPYPWQDGFVLTAWRGPEFDK